MIELAQHGTLLSALLTVGGLMLVQILVSDFAGIRARHLPGSPVVVDHASFHFRATRALANTNESIAVFILLAVTGVLAAAPAALGYWAWAYAGGRLLHTLCYYANLKAARSISFGVALLALLGMLAVNVHTLIG